MKITWTKPYYGIEHTNRNKKGEYCTVHAWKTWAECCYWSEGCGFSPPTKQFDSLAEAKASAEEWMNSR